MHNLRHSILSAFAWAATIAILASAQLNNATLFRLAPTGMPTPHTPSRPVQVCNQLAAQMNSTVVRVREDDEFQSVARGAWNLFNTLYEPACIVFPESDSHVQTTMKAIFDSGGVRYAVQAGGHSAMRGWNTVGGDGILISFAHMRGVSYDAAKDTITLQPGVRWGEALTDLEPLGVAPMGGRLPNIGTGLLLGGGLSYLSARHGYSVDALVEADVVLVNGEMVTATAKNQYSDLFKALKGGANRFGIVTRYEVNAIHVGTNDDKRFWGGSLVFDNSSTEGLLRAVADYVDKVDDPGSSLLAIFGYTFSNTTAFPVNIITFFYNGTEDPTELYSDFFALNVTQSLVGDFSYLEATQILGNGDERGLGQLFGASAFGNAEYENVTPDVNFERYLGAYSQFLDFVEAAQAVTPITNPDAERKLPPFNGGGPPRPSPQRASARPTTSRVSVPPPATTSMTRSVTRNPPESTNVPRPPSPPGNPPWPIFPGPIFPGPYPGPPSSTDAGIAAALLAFTPVLKSQILASRAKGGTAMDPPVANHHLVQFHVQTLPGFNTDLSRIQDARVRLLRAIPPSPGIPLYMNECDENQQVFATYRQYDFLKATYKKYDPTRFNMRFTDGPLGL